MKVELKLMLDIPETTLSNAELEDAVYTAIVHHARMDHLKLAIDAIIAGKVETPDEDPRYRVLMNHHNIWADILEQPEWKITLLDPNSDPTPLVDPP